MVKISSKIFLNQLSDSWHSLSLPSTSLSCCWVLSFPLLSGPTNFKPSQIDLDWGVLEARSFAADLHHPPSWTSSSYVEVCLRSLSCWKTNDGPTKWKPDNCVLNFDWVTSKAPPHHHVSSFMLHSRNRTFRNGSFTPLCRTTMQKL